MAEKDGGYYVQKKQLLAAEEALKAFRAQKEAEKSEFAAEFQRLSAEHEQTAKGRDELLRRVRLANAAALLECTDAELKELIMQKKPDADKTALNAMHKEQLVDYLRQISLN